jgi:hypothetical protein
LVLGIFRFFIIIAEGIVGFISSTEVYISYAPTGGF